MQSENFDVLIIGGGATGAGCAIDSVTRGKIYLVQNNELINIDYFIYFNYNSNIFLLNRTITSQHLCLSGLKTALVELDDFASGTSSRSTKLIHGGVRYLQKAILNLDWEQYKMVKEALHERSSMLKTAPHLTHAIPIMLPVYEYDYIPIKFNFYKTK